MSPAGTIKHPTGNGLSNGVAVRVNRICEVGIVSATQSFTRGPAIICAFHSKIDLLPGTLTDIVNMNFSGQRITSKRVRIAQPQSPDFSWRTSRSDKRIVRRNGSIGIYPQKFAG